MNIGHHRTWDTEDTMKTDISSALVHSMAGMAGVTTVCVQGKGGAGDNGCSSRMVINIVKGFWKGEHGRRKSFFHRWRRGGEGQLSLELRISARRY